MAALARAVFSLLFLLAVLFPLSAQNSRSDIKVFIARPVSSPGITEQEDFFAEQFKMEIGAANYTVTDNRDEADYLILLTVDNNDYWGQPDEKRYILALALVRTADNKEIVQFAWPFTEMSEMYQWNLYLVYQALANVPMTRETNDHAQTVVEREQVFVGGDGVVVAGRDEHWRNKWLYLNFCVGADMAYLVREGSVLTDQGMIVPVGFLGAEIQFLDTLSVELDAVKVRLLHDTEKYIVTLCPAAVLKWVFKPDDYAMIEPYAGAEYAIALSGENVPQLSVLGGAQFGFRGGSRGAFVIDLGICYSLKGTMRLPEGTREHGLMRVTFSIGYKLGFWDRK
jgi:hypothetical protein